MRLWTVHPKYLDCKGLVAAWREALLAQKVLAGKTQGYRHHPQLTRFRSHAKPRAAIATFLAGIAEEGRCRGYSFDVTKISSCRFAGKMPETTGQLLYELCHLRSKPRKRAPHVWWQFRGIKTPEPHPLYRI